MTALLLALLAAAAPTLASFDGDVTAGKDGKWEAVRAGQALDPEELVKLGPGASATITLPDGRSQALSGKAIVLVKRILESGAMARVWSSRALQDSMAAVGGTTALAVRGANAADVEQRARQRSGHAVAFLGDDPKAPSDAARAEALLANGDRAGAAGAAAAALSDPKAPPLERRRAQLVAGIAAAQDGDFTAADAAFAAAAAPAEGAEGEPTRPLRASALERRAEIALERGDDAAADAGFRAAIDLAPDGDAAARGQFFLGAIALAQDDREAAKSRFARLAAHPDLRQAADQLLNADR